MARNDNIWFIIQVNPQCEDKAAGEIRRAGFRAYVPKRARLMRHHRTKQQSTPRRPALVGYIFIRFPSGIPNWYKLRQCQGVKGVLHSTQGPYVLSQQAVAAIMRQQRSMAFDDDNTRVYRRGRLAGEKNALTKARFLPGMRVSPIGAAERIIAKIVRVTERGTIEGIVDMLGKETRVEFTDVDGLEVLDHIGEAA